MALVDMDDMAGLVDLIDVVDVVDVVDAPTPCAGGGSQPRVLHNECPCS